MFDLQKFYKFTFILCAILLAYPISGSAQDRYRVVGNEKQEAVQESSSKKQAEPRKIIVIGSAPKQDKVKTPPKLKKTKTPPELKKIIEPPKLKKTVSSKSASNAASTTAYMTTTTRAMMMDSIRSKLGIRYRYATAGPSTYDCSGFVWKVFNDAGIPMTRTSAKVYWRTFEPVKGKDRFAFGTLVFFNRLGHVGIVVDKKGFYHASSSKGVTYSPFAGYWSRRIVGFRRIPINAPTWSEEKDKAAEDPDIEN